MPAIRRARYAVFCLVGSLASSGVIVAPSLAPAAPADVAATGPWGEVHTVVQEHRAGRTETELVRTRSGRHVAVWLRGGLNQLDVPVAKVRFPGGRWAESLVLSRFRGALEVRAEAHGRDRVTVAWKTSGHRRGWVQVWTRTLRPGRGWAPAVRVAVYHDDGGATGGLALGVRGDRAVVAWNRKRTVDARYRDQDGVWHPVQSVPGANRSTSLLHAAITAAGDAHLVASDFTNDVIGPVIKDYVRTVDGGWSSDSVGGVSETEPVVSVDANPDGDLAVSWTREVDGRLQPVVRTRPAGGDFEEVHELAMAGRRPKVNVTGEGLVVAAWEEPVDDMVTDVHLARRRLDGSWTLSERVVSSQAVELRSADANRRGAAVLVLYRYEPASHAIVRCRRSTPCEGPAYRPTLGLDFKPQVAVGPGGGALILYSTNCPGENCARTQLRSIRLLHSAR